MERSGTLLALLVWTGLAYSVGAQAQAVAEGAHAHAHAGDSGALVSKLQLDAGKRWPTDTSLREGMAAIRAAFDADHGRIHAGQQTDQQYEALAASIETQVQGIAARCKLPPDADAQLHYVIADLLQGVALMRGEDVSRARHDGAARVHGALLAYAQYFDDPTWRPDAPVDRH